MKLPGVVPVLVVYGVCLLISQVPSLFPTASWTQSNLTILPLGLMGILASVALFLSAFVINEKRAILVPVVGVFVSTLLVHYLRHYPAEFQSQFPDGAFSHLRLRSELWNAIKYPLPEALLVTGLGVFAARWWSPRVKSDTSRTTIPEVKPALILFFACLIPLAILTTVGLRGQIFYYPYLVIEATAGAFALIAMFCISAVALRPWTVLLPLVMVAVTICVIMFQPAVECTGGRWSECLEFVVPVARNVFISTMTIFLVAVIAGIAALDEKKPTELPPTELDAVEPAV